MLIPFSTPPAHPICCLFTPAVASPFFSCPDSSSAPIRNAPRRAASSRPDTANRRTTPIAAKVSQAARFSSRCVRSGVRSPTCWAMLQPFRFGRPLITAPTYFPACKLLERVPVRWVRMAGTLVLAVLGIYNLVQAVRGLN